jgi:hypothetical protein
VKTATKASTAATTGASLRPDIIDAARRCRP